jgi:glycosyltransferase involved in cell wall biosynthesis
MKGRCIKLSVIMASFNASAYLGTAVVSVLDQSLFDLELILIDDCSTDNTLDIANSLAMRDNRITVISLPIRSGPAVARNYGLSIAKGEWIGILDSDDIALPMRFSEQMKMADDDEGLVMIGSDAIIIDAEGRVIKRKKYPTSHRGLIKRLYTMQAFPPHSSMVYKKDVLEKLSGFNTKYSQSEDYDLWLRMSKAGRISSADKALVRIRKHVQSLSNEDGGILQVRLAYAALVSHYLRIYGYPDPSNDGGKETWRVFVEWVNRRMIEENVFGEIQTWALARASYFSAENRLKSMFCLIKSLLKSGSASAIIWERLLGTTLPKRLAKEWITLN